MGHKSYEELKELLVVAKSKIKIGDRYVHYKDESNIYEIKDIVLIEATEGIGIIYSPLKEPEIKWIRPLEEFFEEIKTGGKTISRFIKV